MGWSGAGAARQGIAPQMHVMTRDNNLMALILSFFSSLRFFVHDVHQEQREAG
jgi:hypothetical protein